LRGLTGDEAVKEGLAGKLSVVLLEVLLGGGAELHGNKLEAAYYQRTVLPGFLINGCILLTHAARSGR